MLVHVKVIHIRHNLFTGTETLTLSFYEPIAMHLLWGVGGSPIWEEGVELGESGVVPCE